MSSILLLLCKWRNTTWFEKLLRLDGYTIPTIHAQTGDFGYYTLPVTPLFHAFVDLDEKFTINLILWDEIDQQCDACWMEDPTQISLILSTYTRKIMKRPYDKQKTPSIGDNAVVLTYTSSIKYGHS